MEKSHWSDVNRPIIDRLKRTATTAVEERFLTPLEEVHVLDLAKDGHIKPHTDSVKVQSTERREHRVVVIIYDRAVDDQNV